MFEGNPPRQVECRPLDYEQSSEVLRELTWAELVSRLAASRGIRGHFSDECGEASFDAGSARRIAAHHSGKEFLNHDSLVDGKEPTGTGSGVTLALPDATRK